MVGVNNGMKKPGCEIKRNRANEGDSPDERIHQWERAGKDLPQTAQVRWKYRAHILSWCMGQSADSSMPELTKGYYSLSFVFA